MFFFFKQETAYEMRISDWSSYVCSSDLCGDLRVLRAVADPRTRSSCELSRVPAQSLHRPDEPDWAGAGSRTVKRACQGQFIGCGETAMIRSLRVSLDAPRCAAAFGRCCC